MGRIQTRVAAVIKLMDLYTGRPVDEKNIRISIQQQNKVMMKQGGFVIILEASGVTEVDMRIESAIYQSREIKVKVGVTVSQNGYPVWLQPKRNYPFSMGTTFLKGHTGDGLIMLSIENRERPIRLMADYEAGSSLIQLVNAGEYADGRYYRIGTKEQGEIFQINSEAEEVKQGYFLQNPCQKNYKRTESSVTSILPVMVEKQEFYIGIAGIPKDGTVCKLYKQDICVKELYLEYGKENKL